MFATRISIKGFHYYIMHSEVLLQTSAQDSPTAKVESSLVIKNSSGKLHPLLRALFQVQDPSVRDPLCVEYVF